jgi:uncharacterized protein (TIGR03790 family)
LVAAVLGLGGLAADLQAAGSGLNVAVVVNQASLQSIELGNYYCERRQVPAENLVRISWSGGNTTWTQSEFQTVLLDSLQAALAQRQLTNQVRYVVLSMDIPFAVSGNGQVNSTTSSLFYGFKDSTKSNENSYARSEAMFGPVVPLTAPGYSYLATMITAGTLAQAKALVDQGVNSDATFPTQTVILAKSSDSARNIRHPLFDNAIFQARLAGFGGLQRLDTDVVSGRSNLLGFQTGLASFSISPDTFVPGAIADSMTSYAGVIFGPNSQTSLLAFIHAGAAGSYGTVTEPGAVASKFPDPLVYFYQARGFSLAECYYQAVPFPHQGLIVGEPLAAPFCQPGAGQWVGVVSNAMLSGTAPLTVRFSAADPARPLQQVDLFVDGRYFQTLTNLAPGAGNQLTLNFAGGTVRYTVPANATLSSLAGGLVVAIGTNGPLSTHLTATTKGDRIEVRSVSGNRPQAPRALVVSGSPPAGPPPSPNPSTLAETTAGSAPLLTTVLSAARESSLESTALGSRACIVAGTPQAGSWLQLSVTKTNGATVTVAATNQSAGVSLLDFTGQLVSLANATAGLQGTEGLRIEDLKASASTVSTFNLKSRAPGYAAAGLRFSLTASTGLTVTVAANDLRENLADLLPRNHIYVRAGLTNLPITFPLDTTRLEDGWHELTAVAYEGSHVRTQARVSIPVRVQNTSLTATLALPGFPEPAPAGGTYPVEVTASQGGIAVIRLFSTGGELARSTGQSSAGFALAGAALGVGRHPVWAEVETDAGGRYRTETRWIQLISTP